MKKALVIGGSNGIGLAVCQELISKGFIVEIADKINPQTDTLTAGKYHFTSCDLTDFDEVFFQKQSEDHDLELVMITAGFGRFADFEYFHTAEIEKSILVNELAPIKLIRIFYDRIKSQKDFYFGVMCSIAGHLSSPSCAVYSAAKAAVVRLIESVNVELSFSGFSNRILDVSPGVVNGTKFHGGENDLEKTIPFANELMQHLFNKETLWIPQYEEIYRDVLERYQKNPEEFGIQSYKYKKDNGRIKNENRVVIGYLSGTFDLFHVGHLNLLKKAKEQCDYLIVGVHDSGAWKGKETFIPLEERKAIVRACRYVDKVVDSCREDSDAWDLWHYHKLFVGSDYKGTERFLRYEAMFASRGVEIVYFPYTAGTSSTQIRDSIMRSKND